MSTSALVSASRFYQRWLSPMPPVRPQIDSLAQLSLASLNFADVSASEQGELPLARGMRRLRNLVLATLIRRDLEGKADLDEVVTTMTRLADFAIQRHLAELDAAMRLAHGVPVGADSGERAADDGAADGQAAAAAN